MKSTGAALVALLTASCFDKGDRFDPIVVDIAANCAVPETQVLLADMDAGARPWDRVLSVATDAAGLDAYWTLVQITLPDDPNVARLALLHVDSTEVDAQYIVEGNATLSGTTLELRSGPIPGTAWLIQTGSGVFRVWHVDASRSVIEGGPLVAASLELAGFPAGSAWLCTDDDDDEPGPCDVGPWPRDLVFLRQKPHVVAVPPQSPNDTTYIYVAPLSAQLVLEDPQQLEFFRKCDPADPIDEYTECIEENELTSYPELTLMGSQATAEPNEHRLFILRQRSIDREDEPELEIVFVRLSLDDRDKPAGILQSKVLKEVDPLTGSPNGLATDEFATYMLHATADPTASGGVGPVVVTRLSELEDEFDVLQGIIIPDDIDILQIENDVALGRVDEEDGAWEVTKLFPDAPERSETVRYEAATPVTRVEPAGHGSFLLFKEGDDGPDLVHVKCADEDPVSEDAPEG
jgi:hypothetical protein